MINCLNMLVCGTLNHLHKNHLFQLYAELSLKLRKKEIFAVQHLVFLMRLTVTLYQKNYLTVISFQTQVEPTHLY